MAAAAMWPVIIQAVGLVEIIRRLSFAELSVTVLETT